MGRPVGSTAHAIRSHLGRMPEWAAPYLQHRRRGNSAVVVEGSRRQSWRSVNHSLTSSFIACNRGCSDYELHENGVRETADANIHDTFCEYNEATITVGQLAHI